MRQLSREEATSKVLLALDFNSTKYTLTSAEVVATLLRRAGSFRCPCSGIVLIQSVTEALTGLVEVDSDLLSKVESVLDELIAYGDFTEVERAALGTPSSGRLLYTTSPSFVVLPNGRILLLGITPESTDWLPSALAQRLELRGHVRTLPPGSVVTAPSLLRDAGYFEVPEKLWLQAPKVAPAKQVHEYYCSLLQETGELRESTD